jgi:hypothetical protein
MKQLSSGDWASSRKSLLIQSLIQPSNILRSKAVRQVERYDLRAADSLQLAAALGLVRGRPSRTCLSDRRSEAEGSGCDLRSRSHFPWAANHVNLRHVPHFNV